MISLPRALAATLLTFGAVAASSPAQAAPNHDNIDALTENDAAGQPAKHPIHRGETVSVTLGVVNNGPSTVHGIILDASAFNHIAFPHTFTNCLYWEREVGFTGVDCLFDQDLPPGETYAVEIPVTATDEALPETTYGVDFWFSSESDVKANIGTVEDLATSQGGGKPPTRGTSTPAALAPHDLSAWTPGDLGTAALTLVTESGSPSPSPSETSSPTTTPSTTPPGTGGTGGGDGGGLPVTGTKPAIVATAGTALLTAGATIFILSRRRRRTRFTA